jgi:hypothetical protein
VGIAGSRSSAVLRRIGNPDHESDALLIDAQRVDLLAYQPEQF